MRWTFRCELGTVKSRDKVLLDPMMDPRVLLDIGLPDLYLPYVAKGENYD